MADNAVPPGNQWALLTEFEISHDYIDVYGDADLSPHYIRGAGQIRFSGIAPATPYIMAAMEKWMRSDRPQFPIYAEEWLCLYCGTPNPLPKTCCSQCGAPRNWLIG